MESGTDMAWRVEKVKRNGGGGEQETSEASEMSRGGARARR
jgi:hypothetical protein